MTGKTLYNEIAGQKIQRMEALSDGVFAIALTLLVLDIKVPVDESIKTESALFASLCRMMPKFLSYFLSFMTMGIFWVGQSAQLNHLEKYDRNLNWLSLFFLPEHVKLSTKLFLLLYYLVVFLLSVPY